MADFPTSVHSPINPTSGNNLSNPTHSQLHQSHGAELAAVQTKVGTGSSTPSSGKVLRATGTGASAWGAADLSTDVTGTLLVANGGTGVTTSTGSGANVLGTSPAITSPTISGTVSGGATYSSPTLTTPTIASFANAQHDHSNAAGGGTLTHTALPAGAVVQVVSQGYSAVATGTTVLPGDDTIPQNTEGTEFMTLSITPKSATNILVIEVVFMGAPSAADYINVALFQDSTANALAANSQYRNDANALTHVTLAHKMVAGTTSSTTFKIRAGMGGAGTVTFNGQGGNRRFGAINKSFIKITEYKA